MSGRYFKLMAGAFVVASLTLTVTAARAQDCVSLLDLFQQGRSVVEISRLTGLTTTDVADCRRELSRPIHVGPAGPPPLGAAGPAPRGAAGRPPIGAAGAPPIGAAGPPPIGRDVRRLP